MSTTTAPVIPVVPAVLPTETVTPIRPSEAIRLGCLTTRQTQFTLAESGTACALGAMLIGFGHDPDREDDDYQLSHALLGSTEPTPCPDCGEGPRSMWDSITDNVTHLNDHHKWSRERIADWLEGLGL